jgi:hypothetical protein
VIDANVVNIMLFNLNGWEAAWDEKERFQTWDVRDLF